MVRFLWVPYTSFSLDGLRAPRNHRIPGRLTCHPDGVQGTVLWISAARTLFPPALKAFDIAPERFLFQDLKNQKEVLWAMDEALKCSALTAVIGEVRDITFTESAGSSLP